MCIHNKMDGTDGNTNTHSAAKRLARVASTKLHTYVFCGYACIWYRVWREPSRVGKWLSPKEVMLLLNTIRYRFKSIYDLLEFRYLMYGKTYAATAIDAATTPTQPLFMCDLFFQRRRKCSNNVTNSIHLYIHGIVCSFWDDIIL